MNKIVSNPMFEIFELMFLLDQIHEGLLNMVPFDFSKLVLHPNSIDIEEVNYFKRQEVLEGKTICDLFLQNPSMIKKILK